MAAENEDFSQLLEEIEEEQLIFLQAYIRGTLTRRWLQDLRQEYQQVSHEIERKEVNIEWPLDQPCLPKIIRKRHKRYINTTFSQFQESKQSVEIQTDPEINDNKVIKTDSVSPQGSGTSVDPVIINDSILQHSDSCNHLDFMDSVPVKESEQSKKSERSSEDVQNEQPQKQQSETDIDKIFHTYSTETKNHEGQLLEETNLKEKPGEENITVADMTSVWDAELSSFATDELKLPSEKTELKELRKNLAMELLWIQQAIQSRKNYLKLKNQMVTKT